MQNIIESHVCEIFEREQLRLCVLSPSDCCVVAGLVAGFKSIMFVE